MPDNTRETVREAVREARAIAMFCADAHDAEQWPTFTAKERWYGFVDADNATLAALGLAVVPVAITDAMYDAGAAAVMKQAVKGVGPQPGDVWRAMVEAARDVG